MNERLGQIVVLNGAPRSGKSSIARAMQRRLDGVWINLGVDVYQTMTPPHLHPGIGLRPGADHPGLLALIPKLFAAMYDSIAAHSRHGLNVVVDVGHHDAYPQRLDILPDAAQRLRGLPAWLVGVRCPIDVIMHRRRNPEPGRESAYQALPANDEVPAPVLAWQNEVHRPGLYDLEVDTAQLTADECADRIAIMLNEGARSRSAFARIEALTRTGDEHDR